MVDKQFIRGSGIIGYVVEVKSVLPYYADTDEATGVGTPESDTVALCEHASVRAD